MLHRHPHTPSQVVTPTKPRTHSASQKHPKQQLQIIVSASLVNSSSPLTSHLCEFLLVYYRIYAEDGAIPSKTPVAPGDLFLGRIKVRSVPPPRTVKAVKRNIAKVEDIKDLTSTSLFLTLYSQSPMDDADMFTTLNGTGPGSMSQEPVALIAQISDSDRSALEFEGRVGSAAEPDTAAAEIRYRTSIKNSPTFHLNCYGKCTIYSTPTVMRFHRK